MQQTRPVVPESLSKVAYLMVGFVKVIINDDETGEQGEDAKSLCVHQGIKRTP